MKRAHLVILGAAAAIVVVGSVLHPVVASVPEPPAVVVEPVESSRLVCPDPIASADVQSAVTAMVTPGLPGQKVGTGGAQIATLPPKGTAVEKVSIPAAGAARTLSTAGTPLPPVVASAKGSLAPGLVLDQMTLGDQGKARGLAAMECAAPGTDQWFVGGGSDVGRTSVVTLANPEESPASVDVLLWGPMGPLPAPGGRGVFVPARGQVRLSLSALAPGVPQFVVHVDVQSGRVSAAVSDQQVTGLIPRGVDWVPSAAAPSTTVVVVGIPARVTPVQLSVLSPDHDATVKVRLLTPSGSFSPAGLTTVSLTAGQVEVVDLTKVLREQPSSVELTSTVPIIAGAWYRLGEPTGVGEFAYAGSAPALTGPAAVAGLPSGSTYRHRLYITNTAGDRDVTVMVTTINRQGKATKTKLKITRGSTQVWTAKPPGEGSFSLVVTPPSGSGMIRVARVTSLPAASGTMATGVPMSPVRSKVSVPEAQPNLAVANG